ncbi:S8 family serine peptidase [Butyricimonas sp.]|uniref:S8 family serine peptidase n=1 Tax=Butyricimonas sp. TaxID=1969738 RepID=UPI0025BFB045|nr:S8 family serine peptidase [Butyricimonas sp.]
MGKNSSILAACLFMLFLSVGCEERMDGLKENGELTVQVTPVSGKIFIRLERNALDCYTSGTGLARVTEHFGKVTVSRLFPSSVENKERHRKAGLDLWYKVEFDPSVNTEEVQRFYQGQSGVERVVCDEEISFQLPQAVVCNNLSRSSGISLPFNDPYLDRQWHYDEVGMENIHENATIGVFKGWKVTGGDRRVVVAVLDCGVDYLHEDLKNNMWINEKELNGTSGVDDDGNGYVDDIYGYNFAYGTGSLNPHDHGTHVAGTIAAENNNGTGVCGIAGGTGHQDGVRIMSCQIGTTMGSITQNFEALSKAFVYAADNGALICQCSWAFAYSNELLHTGVDYFVKNAGSQPGSLMKGGVVIVAAGNDGTHGMRYPASYESCISVAAVNTEAKRPSYSNFDETVDISAPGGVKNPKEFGIFSTLANNQYGYMNGTSMACPHVSGIAALIISAYGGEGFTTEKLKQILLESCISLNETEPSYAPLMGKGIARVDRALWKDDGVAPEAVNDLCFKQENENYFLVWSNASDPNDGSPRKSILYRSSQPLTAANLNQAEMQEVDLRGKDAGDEITVALPKPADRNTVDYYALINADTWGNISGLSNVVEIRWVQILPEEKPEPEHPDSPEKGVIVFPNPTTGILNVKWGSIQGAKSVNVYDLMARRVYTKILSSSESAGEETVDISRLPAGRYVLKFSSDDGVQAINVVKI